MITLENEERGSYSLGFLHIKINTTESLNNLNELVKNNSLTFSTFLHEYIHFLQNFTTTSGLYSSSFYIQLIKYTVTKIKENKASIIQLPVGIDDDFNRLSIHSLNTIYLGDRFLRNRVIYRSYYFDEVQIIDLSDNVPIKVKKYFVEYTNMDSYKEEKYNFGITALKELVAHKIQNSFEEVNHPDIPYLIAELIIDKELPELKDNDKLKILLCDAALMHLHPAQLFFETIEKLKGTSYPKSPALFYKHIFKDLRYEGKLGNFPNTIKLFDHIYQDICSNYKDAFKSEIFNEELIWLLHILKNAREIRLRNPLFIIDLINSKGKFTIQFKRIIKQLGTPFFINSLDEGGFIPPAKLKKIPKQVYILFSAAELLLNAHGKKGCAMFGLCSKNYVEKNVTNDFCKSNPFERIGEADACSFVQLCKTWGIHEKQYVI